ncbi:Oidioi.mRNA.OKI2018_I69.chr2.g6751.t1.cds [Oikopleura dioica]|uniref:Oidioi.mRNA.OKI2018_I69.chr2.g6751.t1.cds n=1 Tax=Oikopleura dioica TaxID=34765 RepID=A0ABN7T4F9_OIKDI|nr:Oidioi.mRNA.OKI2018_I69.chr2.g6751.t1.cds [Oikopleura dioica]
MVQFYVKCSKPFETIPEWKVIEIQGELNLREDKEAKKDENKPNEGFGGKKFGDIHFDESGTPILVLGHHTMTGKITKVSPPYGVLGSERNEKGDYYVEAIIREKIIFKTRPKPIITHVPTRLK